MVLRFTTLNLRALVGAQLWPPHWCHRYPLTAESGMLVRAAAIGLPGEGYLVHPATSVGVYPKLQGKIPRADPDFAYLDWWFVAPQIAMTFGSIYDDFKAYRAGALPRFPTGPLLLGFPHQQRLRCDSTLTPDVRASTASGAPLAL